MSFLNSVSFHTGKKLSTVFCASLSLADYIRHSSEWCQNDNMKYTEQYELGDSKT